LVGTIGHHAECSREIPNGFIFGTKSRGIQEKNSISDDHHYTIHISLDAVFLQEVPMCERSEHETETTQGKALEIIKKSDERSDSEQGNRIKRFSRDVLGCYNFI